MAPPLASFRRKPESSKTTRRVLLWIPAFARMTEDISWKHSMQKPAWGFGLAFLIEAFAEHPVAAAVLVLDAVIVAHSLLPPPRRGREKRVRDYYRIEDEDGCRYWVFREGLYQEGQAEPPGWFLHGVFP